MCCKKGPCAFGEWDDAAHRCKFLEVKEHHDGFEIYQCGRYDYIQLLPEEAGAKWNPAFGAGCCMSLFNENRQRILRHLVTNGRGLPHGDPA